MSGIVKKGEKFAGQFPDSFLGLLLVGAENPLQKRRARGLSTDEGRGEIVRAGLLPVGEMLEMDDSVVVIHGFVAGGASFPSVQEMTGLFSLALCGCMALLCRPFVHQFYGLEHSQSGILKKTRIEILVAYQDIESDIYSRSI